MSPRLTLLLVALVAALFVAITTRHVGSRLFESPRDITYADRLFANTTPYQRVLVSQYHGLGSGAPPGCSVAVVVLAKNPSPRPPLINHGQPREMQFGGLWRSTPMRAASAGVPNPLDLCRDALGRSAASRITRALQRGGGFYIHDVIGRRLQVYAPDGRLAASIIHSG